MPELFWQSTFTINSKCPYLHFHIRNFVNLVSQSAQKRYKSCKDTRTKIKSMLSRSLCEASSSSCRTVTKGTRLVELEGPRSETARRLQNEIVPTNRSSQNTARMTRTLHKREVSMKFQDYMIEFGSFSKNMFVSFVLKLISI